MSTIRVCQIFDISTDIDNERSSVKIYLCKAYSQTSIRYQVVRRTLWTCTRREPITRANIRHIPRNNLEVLVYINAVVVKNHDKFLQLKIIDLRDKQHGTSNILQ